MTRKLAAALAALTLLAGAAVFAGPDQVRVPAGLLLAFVLPGAALVAVLFRTRGRLSGPEWFTLIPALSLATLVLGGLLVWALGASLDRNTWLGVSGTVTLVALCVAIARPALPAPADPISGDARVQLPTGEDNTLVLPFFLDREGRTAEQPKPKGSPLIRVALPAVLIAAMIGGAAYLSLTSSIGTHDDRVTTLSADPAAVPAGAGNRVVRVAATGLPDSSTSYRVIVTEADGTQRKPQPVTADGAGEWRADLTVPAAERVTIGLYRDGDTAAYRSIIIAAAG